MVLFGHVFCASASLNEMTEQQDGHTCGKRPAMKKDIQKSSFISLYSFEFVVHYWHIWHTSASLHEIAMKLEVLIPEKRLVYMKRGAHKTCIHEKRHKKELKQIFFHINSCFSFDASVTPQRRYTRWLSN